VTRRNCEPIVGVIKLVSPVELGIKLYQLNGRAAVGSACARSLTKYAKLHPELTFSTFVIPQVPGSISRSKPTDGVLESLVKSKKYAAPLLLLSPELVAGMVTVYLVDGRFRPPVEDPEVTVPLLTETNAVTEPATRRVLSAPSEPNATAVQE
jgi:hypothetical protein